MLEFCQVTKQYGTTIAVSDVSFVCRDRSVTVLLGPNGAGKTTLLKAAAGMHYPTAGKVLVNGVSVEDDQVAATAAVALVTELPVLPPHFTVAGYLKTVGKLYHPEETAAERTARAQQIIDQCGLADVLKVKIKALSKGYQQRVSFAQALLKDADNLILDEPVSGLDPAQIIEMRALIKRISAEKTVLLSTHLLQEAEQLSDHIVIMYQGALTASGSPAELLQTTGKTTLEAAYVSCTGGNP
ncbi:MAG: ABC transporter ATP-binding protein [Treponemataceae bacterium]|nr:ABC transporter ATP-binding protein [Treponemataceae bacterium]